jgi:hypothetical protein
MRSGKLAPLLALDKRLRQTVARVASTRARGVREHAAPTGTAVRPHASIWPRERGRLRRSLRACTAEGLVAEVISACAGGAILTAWALHLNASTLVTGMIVALSQLAQLFQFPAAWTTSWLGHRRASIWLVAASRQALLPLALLPFLPLTDAARQTVLLLVAGGSAVLGVLGNNAWSPNACGAGILGAVRRCAPWAARWRRQLRACCSITRRVTKREAARSPRCSSSVAAAAW